MSHGLEIVLASNNSGKINEIRSMLASTGISVVPQSERGVPEAVEDGATFVENALIKARNAASATGLPALADDSGLVVDALGGMPGVISARYSGPNATDESNIRKLLEKLAGIKETDRRCRFVCVMAYMRHDRDASPVIAEGRLEGIVHDRAQGEHGFGYDPVVWLPERGCTLAELPVERKNEISHRSMALREMVGRLEESLDG